MNFEFSTGLQKNREVVDEKWYERFKEIAAFESVNYLMGSEKNREDQKNDFLNGKIENPTLDYPELEKIDFEKKEKDLLELKGEIIKNENNELIAQIYRWKLNEKIAELRMLKASKEGNDKKFFRYSTFIYGKPEKEIYEYTLSQLKKTVDEKISSNNLEVKNAALRLNKELFVALMENETQINPKDYPFKEKGSSENEKEYSTEEIKQAFEQAIKEYALDDWEVFIDAGGKYENVTVIQEEKKIAIPKERRENETGLKALIAHEIETHAVRRKQGEKSRLKLLGLGLDRYIKGEEGVARYKEQEITGNKDFAGLDYHLAISLAAGIDGKKRNFREVYELLKNFYFIRSKKADSGEALELSEKYAWEDCIRIFRGTTCKTPGACLTKDIAYREGNIAVWDLVKKNSEELRRFSIGKYDPGNSRHIWILDQLGITEEDLRRLDEGSLK